VITGFNTDIQHEGVTYHVQTEDKGLDTPLILSLVYVGGAIIASKRTPYEDLVARGFDEKALTERLQRQHKLICAAIRAGRIAELKRMGAGGGTEQNKLDERGGRAASEKGKAKRKKKPEAAQEVSPKGPDVANGAGEATGSGEVENGGEAGAVKGDAGKSSGGEIVILTTLVDEIAALGESTNFQTQTFRPQRIEPLPIYEELHVEPEPVAPPRSLPTPTEETALPQDSSDELYLTLLDDEGDFRAGQLVLIKVHVGRGTYGQRAVAGAQVIVKILGTTFRPLILTGVTDGLGVAVVRALLPRFTSGRSAIIIRAADGEDAVEMRRIIHQA
jgi:hypothetical protein